MIIAVDASAIVAIVAGEPEGVLMEQVLSEAEEAWATPTNLFEAGLVLVLRDGRMDLSAYQMWLAEYGIRTSNMVDHIRPIQAYLQYGKGVHRAGLNMGDCFAYALAKALDAPLLYKGDDFPRTDVASALQPT